jgi:hypothetical protein
MSYFASCHKVLHSRGWLITTLSRTRVRSTRTGMLRDILSLNVSPPLSFCSTEEANGVRWLYAPYPYPPTPYQQVYPMYLYLRSYVLTLYREPY